jgi:hypothetical protein
MCLTDGQLDLRLLPTAGRERPRGIAALPARPESRARQRLPQHCVFSSLSQGEVEKQRGWQRTQSIAILTLWVAVGEAGGCSVTASTLKAS